MTRPPAVDQAQPEQYEQRDRKQHDGDRRGARRLSTLYLPEDVDRGDLGLERLVARYEDHRAELAHGAGETQGRPESMAGRRVGKMIRLKVAKPPAPNDAAASSMSRSSSISTGWTALMTNGSVTKSSAIATDALV